MPAATWGFAMVFCWITADREIVSISLDASPFHQLCRVEEYSKTAFVLLKLQENGYPVQYKLLTMQLIPYRYQTKQTIYPRLAQILRKKKQNTT